MTGKVGQPWRCRARQGYLNGCQRGLFELYAGREAPQLPTNLDLDEASPPDLTKESWINTSTELVNALGPIGQDYARSKEYSHMLDLSYVEPLLVSLDRKKANEKVTLERARQEFMKDQGKVGISRKQILVDYLLHVDPVLKYQARLGNSAMSDAELNDGLWTVFDQKSSKWLQTRHQDVTDVMNWAWILTADMSERAALRLMLLVDRDPRIQKTGRTIPPFLILFLLRRKSVNARTLRILLVASWRLLKEAEVTSNILTGKSSLDQSIQGDNGESNAIVEDAVNGMSEQVFIILIIRLLRQARKVWPAACESIVALLNRYLDGINFQKKNFLHLAPREADFGQLSYVYNTILKLLSLPSSIHPFQSFVSQQRAQFSVLRKMNGFDPPLPVDRRGYQAVVKIQLMHKKSLREREWAQMKAKSWPPWKENKLGIDANIGAERGISRAKEALHQAQESGYSPNEWDATASVLSGWDTDGSPTIQTRSITKHPPDITEPTQGSPQENVWAARIQATRTLEEAWSCFLSWKDQNQNLGTGQQVYLAMFAKLTYRKSTSRTSREPGAIVTSQEELLPGDGPEVFPASVSPYESIYIRRPPPSEDELLDMMKEDGVKPTGRLLSFLISNAWSFEAGMRILETRSVLSQYLSAPLVNDLAQRSRLQETLSLVPPHLFASLIEFLTRFALTMSDKHGVDHNASIKTGLTFKPGDVSHPSESEDHILINPLAKAYEFLLARKLGYRPAWYHLLRALARSKAVTGVYSRYSDQNSQDIKTWRMMCGLLDQMIDIDLHIDLDGFGIVCIGLEKAIFASERQLRYKARFRSQPSDDEGTDDGTGISTCWENHVLTDGLPLVKQLFKETTRSTGTQQEIPESLVKEKSEIDDIVKNEQDKTTDDDAFDEAEIEQLIPQKAFLPPGCLLPRLLEVPNPALLHAFIRILGLRRDYDGLVDLVEWMSLFADEINALSDEAKNGSRMMRKCMTAIRVFLERSWMDVQRDDGCGPAGHDGIVIEAECASAEVIKGVKSVVLANQKWGGWATDDEVVEYCLRGKFL